MFRIITVEREFGCGAPVIAAQLARSLGWKLWDQELTEEIAKVANVDCSEVERREERVDSRLYRLAKSSGAAATNVERICPKPRPLTPTA